MARYNVYIDMDDGNGYFEVFPVRISPFRKSIETNELFRRYVWGEVELTNDPDKYRLTSNNAYRIYDLIKNAVQEQVIKIKFVSGSIEIEGYFGYIDCQYKDDRNAKTIIVTPTTLDQYTDFLENYEEQYALIDPNSSDKIINGDFFQWTDNGTVLYGWSYEGATIEKIDLFQNQQIGIKASETKNEFKQSVEVLKDLNLDFSFKYDLERIATLSNGFPTYGYTEGSKDDRYVIIRLNGIYELQADGSWGSLGNGIKYADQVIAKSYEELVDLNDLTYFFSITSQPFPEDGTLTIDFNDQGFIYTDTSYIGAVEVTLDIYTVLLLDDVVLSTSNTPYISVDVPTVDSTLTRFYPFSVATNPVVDFFYSYPDWDFYGDADNVKEYYFEDDGSPNLARWDAANGKGCECLYSYKNELTLENLETKFEDPNDEFYKCAIYELTVYTDRHVHKTNNAKLKVRNGSKRWRQRCYADVTLARDESFTFDVDGPAGDGWVKLPRAYSQTQGQLWVRKPYNDENDIMGWNIGDCYTYDIGEFTKFRLPTFQAWVRQKVTSTRDYSPLIPDIDPADPGAGKEPQIRTFSRGLLLKDVIKLLYNNVHINYANGEVYSTFFWNDLEEDLSILSGGNSGANYLNVQLNPNPLNNIVCLHTLDFKLTAITDPKEKLLKISFKEFMDDLRSLFIKLPYGNLYWFIDDNYDLHIEHSYYREMKGNTGQVFPEQDFYHNYRYQTNMMYSRIVVDQVNSGNLDFHENVLLFPKIKTGKRGKEVLLESTSKYLTTDIQFCIDNPNDLENGLVLKNFTYDVDGNEQSIYSKTQLESKIKSDKLMLNGNLSLSSIILNYCRVEGTSLEGTVNGYTYKFGSTFRTKVADEITIKKKVDSSGNIILAGIIDGDYLTTLIGTGMVKDLEHDFDNQQTKATLLYVERPAMLAETEADNGLYDVEFDFGTY